MQIFRLSTIRFPTGPVGFWDKGLEDVRQRLMEMMIEARNDKNKDEKKKDMRIMPLLQNSLFSKDLYIIFALDYSM